MVSSRFHGSSYAPTKMCLDGRTVTKGYMELGVLVSQSKFTTVSPPVGLGNTSALPWGTFLETSRPPIVRIDPFARIADVGYHLGRCWSSWRSWDNNHWDIQPYLEAQNMVIFFPIIFPVDARTTIRCIQANPTERYSIVPANTDLATCLVRENNIGTTE